MTLKYLHRAFPRSRYALASACVALAGPALAASLLPGCGGGGGPTTPSPTAPGGPTATPSPTQPTGTPTPAPNVGAAFVFQSNRDGDYELLEARSDGLLQRLTDNSSADIDPAVASDGRIAFASTRFGNSEIFVLGPSSTAQVTNNRFQNSQPTWSPDDKRIAFRSVRDGNSDIYIVDADGRNEKRLTQDESLEAEPAFGADGRIYYTSNGTEDGNSQIFSMAADGTQVRQITSGEASASRAAPSPDARRLAFAGRGSDSDIYVLQLSAGRPQGQPLQFVAPNSEETDPAFACDGRSILFASTRTGTFDIYRSNLDGTGARAVVSSPAIDRVPRAR